MGLFSSGKKEMRRANELVAAAQQKLEAVGIPPIEAQRIVLEAPELVGEFIPELAGFEEMLQGTAFEDIETAPELESAQMQALSTLQEKVDEGGLTAQEEAELNQIMRSAKGEEQAAQQRVLQSMAERGMLGSGQELAARLGASQSAMQDAATQAEQLAAIKAQSELDAVNRLAQMGGQIREQSFGEQAQQAAAKDAIERFNVQQKTANVDRMNQARMMNLQARQQKADEAARLRNQQQMYNKQLIQQQFQNQLARAGGVAQQMNVGAQMMGQQAAAKQAGTGALIGGIATLGAAKIAAGCFAPETPIEMADGNVKEVSKIKIGDEILGGGLVKGVTESAVDLDDVFNYSGVIVTGDHLVNENGGLVKVRDSQNAMPYRSNLSKCYNLSTEGGTIIVNGIEFADKDSMLEEDKNQEIEQILAMLEQE